MIDRHFSSGLDSLLRIVRVTSLTRDNRYTQYLFPLQSEEQSTLVIQIPLEDQPYVYADLGVVKEDQSFVTVCRSNVLHVHSDESFAVYDTGSFPTIHADVPLLEQHSWWAYFTGYSLIDK